MVKHNRIAFISAFVGRYRIQFHNLWRKSDQNHFLIMFKRLAIYYIQQLVNKKQTNIYIYIYITPIYIYIYTWLYMIILWPLVELHVTYCYMMFPYKHLGFPPAPPWNTTASPAQSFAWLSEVQGWRRIFASCWAWGPFGMEDDGSTVSGPKYIEIPNIRYISYWTNPIYGMYHPIEITSYN